MEGEGHVATVAAVYEVDDADPVEHLLRGRCALGDGRLLSDAEERIVLSFEPA